MDDINLDYLTSKKLYNQWNKGGNISSYLYECSGFTSTPHNIYVKINNLCRQLIRNLEHMNSRENDECYTCGRCKLLNYWLYDQVKQILGSDYINIYTQIIKDLHAAWSKYKTHKLTHSGGFKIVLVDPQCKPESHIPNIQDIEDKKNIHEHCLNYYEISKNTFNNVECQKYKTYIKPKTSLYDKFEYSFSKNDTEKCPNYYNKCFSYNPKNFLDATNCPHDLTSAEVPVAKGDQEITTTIHTKEGEVPLIQQEDQQSLSSYGADERVPAKGANPDLKENGDGLTQRSNEGAKPSSAERQTPVLEQEQLPEGEGVQVPIPANGILPSAGSFSDGVALPADNEDRGQGDLATFPSSNNNTPNVMPVGLSLFGIASFSTILYKFTPLRSVFYKLIHMNKSPINHHHEAPEELLEYMITPGSKNRDNRPNYIAYHPA
ncbi:PIR protein [Plasmodium vivax]|uniref:VIR protein n=1 Tax=Plasmodium vivax TaxID=5855 RepID=A0A565A4C1_PLAVI|nr:PIR protein [Plasmodium vivax]